MKNQNLAKLVILELIESGDLKINGTAELFGAAINVNTGSISEEETTEITDQYGFYGPADQYGARRNKFVDDEITKWLKSENEHERAAADLMPKKFVFLATGKPIPAQLSERGERVFRINHNKWLLLGSDNNRLFPLVDERGVTIDEKTYYVALENFSFPEMAGRQLYLDEHFDIQRWIKTLLLKQSIFLSGDGALGLG